MPYSDTRFDGILTALVRQKADGLLLSILDIGVGAGKTSKLVRHFAYSIVGVEAYANYVERFGLRKLYDDLMVMDVVKVDPEEFARFHLAIIGDTLEHLSIVTAQNLLTNLMAFGVLTIVQVPFLYEQGEWEGNPLERHVQPDLTREVMKERYPTLTEVHADDRLGLYIQYP